MRSDTDRAFIRGVLAGFIISGAITGAILGAGAGVAISLAAQSPPSPSPWNRVGASEVWTQDRDGWTATVWHGREADNWYWTVADPDGKPRVLSTDLRFDREEAFAGAEFHLMSKAGPPEVAKWSVQSRRGE